MKQKTFDTEFVAEQTRPYLFAEGPSNTGTPNVAVFHLNFTNPHGSAEDAATVEKLDSLKGTVGTSFKTPKELKAHLKTLSGKV